MFTQAAAAAAWCPPSGRGGRAFTTKGATRPSQQGGALPSAALRRSVWAAVPPPPLPPPMAVDMTRRLGALRYPAPCRAADEPGGADPGAAGGARPAAQLATVARAWGAAGSAAARRRGGGGGGRRAAALRVTALDAAQPFDYESRAKRELARKESQQTQAAAAAAAGPKLKIGIVGFGNFGQFIGKRMVQQGHTVMGFSRGDYSAEAEAMGAQFFRQIDDFCEEHPDVVILCTSILSTAKVLESVPLQRLRRSTLFVDVLSVKTYPKALFLRSLPDHFDVLCTHPMFGPESGKNSWNGLTFQYEVVRAHGDLRYGKTSLSSEDRLQAFLKIWENEGCNMVEMTCEEHDRLAASSQFITHTVGRVLGSMDLNSTPIDTKGYQALLNIKENTEKDSFDLYYGLFMYNQNATDTLDRLEQAFSDVRKQLFSKLHDEMRSGIFEYDEAAWKASLDEGNWGSLRAEMARDQEAAAAAAAPAAPTEGKQATPPAQ